MLTRYALSAVVGVMDVRVCLIMAVVSWMCAHIKWCTLKVALWPFAGLYVEAGRVWPVRPQGKCKHGEGGPPGNGRRLAVFVESKSH